MDYATNVILIESCLQRRASISRELLSVHIHVEPFESIAELAMSWPKSGVLLTYDYIGAIPELVRQMTDSGKCFPIVAFCEAPSAAQIVDAMLAGALDYISWPFEASELVATITRATNCADGYYNSKIRASNARGKIDRLTNREREVLNCIANGLTNRFTGEILAISPRTVEIHRANMLSKLGAKHSSEAIRIAIEAKLGD